MTTVRRQLKRTQVQPTRWVDITDKPQTFDELGLSGPFPFLRIDESQGLSPEQQALGRSNLGLPSVLNLHDPVTIGTSNGLTRDGQQLNLALATTELNGAMSSVDKQKLVGANFTVGSGINITGGGTGRLLGSGTVNVTLDSTVLRTTGEQVITGYKRTRRFGANNGSSLAIVKRFEVGDDALYKLDLINGQNEQSIAGQVTWSWRYTYNASAGIARERDMLGYSVGINVLGGRLLPINIYNNVISEDVANIGNINYRYPVRQFQYGTSQLESLIVGSQLLTTKITGDTKAYIDGGIRTAAPTNGTEATLRIGDIEVDTSTTVTHALMVNVNGIEVEIPCRAIIPT